MAGNISDQTTCLSNLSLTGQLSGNTVTPVASLDLRTNAAVLSIDTRADSNGMTIGQLRVVFAASGISLVYSSGATVYTIGASAVSAAQA